MGTLALSFLLAGTAFAQDNTLTNDRFSVSFTVPEGWGSVDGNERAIFNVKHEESQSQIEVIATELMSADVSEVFYDTFHETLVQSNFTRDDAATSPEESIGTHIGSQTQYTFDYAGVVLRVVIFQFTEGNNAYLIVGYIKDDEFDTHFTAFREAVGSLVFSG
jgi:hypothetical protein